MLNPSFIEDCFGENYIGIRGYCNDQSTSGYFINDEVNITQTAIAKLASSDDVKSSNILNRLIRNAVRDTCNDFLAYLETYGYFMAKATGVCNNITSDLSKQLKIKEVGRYNGLKIDYVQVPAISTMYIDVDGVRETVTLAAGVNELNKVIIGSAVNLHFFTDNAYVFAEDIPIERSTFSYNVVDNDSVSGLSGEVKFRISSICSPEKLICANKEILSRAILFHAVGLFFKEKFQSEKIDPYVSNTKEESKELYQEYLWGFDDKKSKYHEALIYAVKALRQKIKNNYCFTCTGIKVQSLI